MNKTVTINISGIIFHIEEEAFDKLSRYLSTIRGYFKDTEGRDEIMADIEARIAEMLKEKTSAVKQVVLMKDVDEVMEVMGKPEDFAGEGQQQGREEAAPEEPLTGNRKRRRVFRDPDNKMLGGVCSGIASHFDFDPLWLRLAWVVLTLMGGAGILIYIIMWIVIPEAKTTAEKLEMRGEEVNINNIKRNFEEEMEHMKSKMKDFEKNAKEFGNSFRRGGERRDALGRFGDFVVSTFGAAFKVIAKVFAFFLIIICAALIVALVGSLFGFGVINDISLSHFADLVFGSPGQADLAVVGTLLAAGVPLVMLLYAAVRALFQINVQNKMVGYAATGIWLIGVFILIYVGFSVGSDFTERGHYTREIQIVQPKSDTLFLRAPKDETAFDDDHYWGDRDNWSVVSEDGEEISIRYPKLKIEPSEDSNYHVTVTMHACGFDNALAQARAKKIKYEVRQKDSILEFPAAFQITKDDKWRDQDVRIVVYVPKGKMVFIAKNMAPILHDVDNISNTWDPKMVNRRWLMTSRGLACVDCSGLEKAGPPDNALPVEEEGPGKDK
jgi:phage shock protein PspC (stress-responsive transcriptional regulator)